MSTYLVYRIQTLTTTFRAEAESEYDAEAYVRDGKAEELDYENETEYEVEEEK